MMTTYCLYCASMSEVIIIEPKYTVCDAKYYLLMHSCCFIPSTHIYPLILLSLLSFSNIKYARYSEISFPDILLVSDGTNLSIALNWVSSYDTSYSPFSPKFLKPHFNLYIFTMMTPSICSISSFYVYGNPTVSSNLVSWHHLHIFLLGTLVHIL